jgi:hypothetical protein
MRTFIAWAKMILGTIVYLAIFGWAQTVTLPDWVAILAFCSITFVPMGLLMRWIWRH